jgi:hypothetical protein
MAKRRNITLSENKLLTMDAITGTHGSTDMNTNGETFELVKSMFGTQAFESVLVKYLIFLGKAEDVISPASTLRATRQLTSGR